MQGAPSAPSATEIPSASISGMGAMPEPSLRFDDGTVHHVRAAAREPAALLRRRVDAVRERAARTAQPERGRGSAMLSSPRCSRTSAHSGSCSEAWVCTRAPAATRAATSRRSSSRAREHEARRVRVAQAILGRAAASARAARPTRRARRASARAAAPARRRRSPSWPCRWWRAGRSGRARRRARRSRAPCPCRGSPWCPTAAARRWPAARWRASPLRRAWPRRATPAARSHSSSGRSSAAPAAAASGTGGCAPAPGRASRRSPDASMMRACGGGLVTLPIAAMRPASMSTIAVQHALLGIDGDDRCRHAGAWSRSTPSCAPQLRSSGRNASGRIADKWVSWRSPSTFASAIGTSAGARGANSASVCRHIPQGAAGGEDAVTTAHGEDPARTVEDRGRDRVALGADRQAVRRVLHVRAGVDLAVVGEHGRADAIARVGRIRAVARGARGGEQGGGAGLASAGLARARLGLGFRLGPGSGLPGGPRRTGSPRKMGRFLHAEPRGGSRSTISSSKAMNCWLTRSAVSVTSSCESLAPVTPAARLVTHDRPSTLGAHVARDDHLGHRRHADEVGAERTRASASRPASRTAVRAARRRRPRAACSPTARPARRASSRRRRGRRRSCRGSADRSRSSLCPRRGEPPMRLR